MLGFFVLHASRFVMVSVALGSLAAVAHLSRSMLRDTYAAGMVTLTTAARERRRVRLGRVVATPWVYTSVFAMILTALAGMGMLMRDTGDLFGFQRHVLSWEYILHPRYMCLLCACAVSAALVSFGVFSAGARGGGVMDLDAYDAAWRAGFVTYMSVALAGFCFFLLLESKDEGFGGGLLRSHPRMGEAFAALLLYRAPMSGAVSGVDAGPARRRVRERVLGMGVSQGALEELERLAFGMPRRLLELRRTIQGRMRAAGFDEASVGEAARAVDGAARGAAAAPRKETPPAAAG